MSQDTLSIIDENVGTTQITISLLIVALASYQTTAESSKEGFTIGLGSFTVIVILYMPYNTYFLVQNAFNKTKQRNKEFGYNVYSSSINENDITFDTVHKIPFQ